MPRKATPTPARVARKTPRLWLWRSASSGDYLISTKHPKWLKHWGFDKMFCSEKWEAYNPCARLAPGAGPVEIIGGFKLVKPKKKGAGK